MAKTRSTAITSRKRIAAIKAAPTSKAISKPASKLAKTTALLNGKSSKKAITKKLAKTVKGQKYLDLGLLLDVTSSMYSWIARAKNTLKTIIDNVKKSCDGLTVRVSFVGYRDHCDSKRFDIMNFGEDIDAVKRFIEKVSASGGGDWPEDVTGGMN